MRLGLIDRLRGLARRRETVGRHRRDAASDAELRDRGRPASAVLQPSAQRALQPRRTAPPQPTAPWGSLAGPGVPAATRVPAVPRKTPAAPEMPALGGGGIGRARIRELPAGVQSADARYTEAQYGAAPVEAPPRTVPREPWYQVVADSPAARQGRGGIAARTQALAAAQAQVGARTSAPARLPVQAAARARLPYVAGHPIGHPPTLDGRRNCGPLERILHRQWHEGATLPAAVITAVDRLAELPRHLQQKLADGLTGIFVGPGGVPELDDMGALRGVALPSGRATWDACAGAYGERKLVVGSRLSPTPDVMCHEVGHALDDLDAPAGKWQSDSPEFKAVYDQCKPHIVSDFHRQRGGLGRKEFFADAFAAIASGQRPALVDMLGGDTRSALWVMLYFNRRYGI
jgi:hypothetical protein